MATFSNQSKTAAGTMTNESANASSPNRYYKAGQKYNYDSHIPYDGVDPISGTTVYYDSVGTAPSYSNQSKS